MFDSNTIFLSSLSGLVASSLEVSLSFLFFSFSVRKKYPHLTEFLNRFKPIRRSPSDDGLSGTDTNLSEVSLVSSSTALLLSSKFLESFFSEFAEKITVVLG